MNNKFQQNFNTFTNIFILFILFFGGFVWADTNGVWQYASDTRGGIFGADEQAFTTNFTFINPVNFYDKLSISKNLGISHIIINSVNSYSAIEFSNSSDNKWGIGKDSQDNFYIDETGISNRLLIKKGGNTRIKGNLEVNGILNLYPQNSQPFACSNFKKGSIYYNSNSNMIFICNGISWTEFRGPQGATGLKGDTGLTGLKGDTGLTGLKGDTGLTGLKGDTGLTGLKGDTGSQGPPGTSSGGLTITIIGSGFYSGSGSGQCGGLTGIAKCATDQNNNDMYVYCSSGYAMSGPVGNNFNQNTYTYCLSLN